MQALKDMPINRKVTLVILLTAGAVLLAAGVALIFTELVTSRRVMAEDLNVAADLLGRNVSANLHFHRDEDVEEINKSLGALRADPHIILTSVYDNDGHPYGGYRREAALVSPPAPPPEGSRFGKGYLEVVRPIISTGIGPTERVGTILVRADLTRMNSRVAVNVIIIGLVLLLSIVITVILSPRLRRPIAGPILELARVAARVARDKDYSLRVRKRGGDEVGMLTDTFNQMLDEIAAAQDELTAAKDRAVAANRAKDEFLAVLSHELRTPLTPVLLATSLLQNQKLPPDLKDVLETIRRHVELEARLIDDLLDLTRITRGKLSLNREITDIHKLLADALRICCAERMDDVTKKLDAPDHYVNADPGRLLQIFWNLLNNAKKFTPAGGQIRVLTSNPSPHLIRIEISDTGLGIEPELLPRIFNAFEQGEPAAGRKFGGLGLGLAISKALVDAHHGTIQAHSSGPGQGSCFTVELQTIDVPKENPADSRPSLPPPPPQTAPLRILLVEDHPGTLELVTRLLVSIGYDVEPAATVRQALSIANDQSIDLVISDLGLPDGTGFDLMKELKESKNLKGICVSGFGMEADIARSADAGFVKHLTKPIDFNQLEEAIRSAVGR